MVSGPITVGLWIVVALLLLIPVLLPLGRRRARVLAERQEESV